MATAWRTRDQRDSRPVGRERRKGHCARAGGRSEDLGDIGPQGPTGDTGARGPVGDRGPVVSQEESTAATATSVEKARLAAKALKGLKGQIGEASERVRKALAATMDRQVGDKGFTGDSGDIGDKGDRGQLGDVNTVYVKGATAARARSVTRAIWGDRGQKGRDGDAKLGTDGRKEIKAELGDTGPKGVKGKAGEDALKGPAKATRARLERKGNVGLEGDKGITGVEGSSSGPLGKQGRKGAVGPDGRVGAKGELGERGAKGVAGFKGRQRADWAHAARVAKSATGAATVTKERGDSVTAASARLARLARKAPGSAGSRGSRRPRRREGSARTTGPKGDLGEAGPIGDKGPPGPKGQQGDHGDDGGDNGSKGEPAATVTAVRRVATCGATCSRCNSQRTDVPGCPSGTQRPLGRLLVIMSVFSNSYTKVYDLGSPGSCLRRFNVMPFSLCENSQELPQRPEEQPVLLAEHGRLRYHGDGNGLGHLQEHVQYISRCAVCYSPSKVYAFHNYTNTRPNCPSGWRSLWDGHSLLTFGPPQTPGDSVQPLPRQGSCLRFKKNMFMRMPRRGQLAATSKTFNTLWLRAHGDRGTRAESETFTYGERHWPNSQGIKLPYAVNFLVRSAEFCRNPQACRQSCPLATFHRAGRIVSDVDSESLRQRAASIDSFRQPIVIRLPSFIRDTPTTSRPPIGSRDHPAVRRLRKPFLFTHGRCQPVQPAKSFRRKRPRVRRGEHSGEHPDSQRPDASLLSLLNPNLERNDFGFNGSYFPAGSKAHGHGKVVCAPSYSNIYMGYWEAARTWLAGQPQKPALWLPTEVAFLDHRLLGPRGRDVKRLATKVYFKADRQPNAHSPYARRCSGWPISTQRALGCFQVWCRHQGYNRRFLRTIKYEMLTELGFYPYETVGIRLGMQPDPAVQVLPDTHQVHLRLPARISSHDSPAHHAVSGSTATPPTPSIRVYLPCSAAGGRTHTVYIRVRSATSIRADARRTSGDIRHSPVTPRWPRTFTSDGHSLADFGFTGIWSRDGTGPRANERRQRYDAKLIEVLKTRAPHGRQLRLPARAGCITRPSRLIPAPLVRGSDAPRGRGEDRVPPLRGPVLPS
uniref:Collagen IV NC1 domain-containing protein n=1 Tax=Macrostomum lignano TaxID=282301 RepID=A0A1I8FP47_9PLAT